MESFFLAVSMAKWVGAFFAALVFAVPPAHLARHLAAGRGLATILERIIVIAENVNGAVGRVIAWLALAMVLVQFAVVGMRYVFGVGSLAMQESIIYLHATLFLAAAGFTLMRDGHVRVDLFYRAASPERRALVNLLGTYLFLVPFCLLVLSAAEPYVANAWRVLERSPETSGLPGVFLLKSTILVFAGLVLVEGAAMAARSALVLTGEREEVRPDAAASTEEHGV